jgi:hypothetical protein
MKRQGIVLLALYLGSLAVAQAEESSDGHSRAYEVDILADTFSYGKADIDADIELVFQGCPQRDCIPSIDQPKFLNPAEVDFLEADDLVLSISHKGVTRAYPTRILDRHEIVNDNFADTAVLVSYCPLCGSGLAFVRTLDGQDVEFGVSGLLHNNDLIMYDRKFNSLWQQITGQAIAGPKRGDKLDPIPVTMALWEDWKRNYPDAEVLALPDDPAHYTRNAYGDYASSDRLLFPVTVQDARLHVKKVIYGAEIGQQSIAVDAEWLKQMGAWEHAVNGAIFRLEIDAAGAVVGSLNGQAIPVHRMFWFAWYSFHPDTSLIDHQSGG